MSKFAILILTILLLLGNLACLKSNENLWQDSNLAVLEPQKLSYCDIAMNPEKYSGRTFLLKGVYMLRFEASGFISYSCQTQIPFVANFNAPPCNEFSKIEKWDWSSPMADRAHGVIVKGWFENKVSEGRSTGEPSKYYKFNVDCIDKIEQLGVLAVLPKEKTKIVEEKIKNFEKL